MEKTTFFFARWSKSKRSPEVHSNFEIPTTKLEMCMPIQSDTLQKPSLSNTGGGVAGELSLKA